MNLRYSEGDDHDFLRYVDTGPGSRKTPRLKVTVAQNGNLLLRINDAWQVASDPAPLPNGTFSFDVDISASYLMSGSNTMGAPLLGALVGASLLLERARQRELVAYAREAVAAANQQQLQREKKQAQLQLLQAQVEPHFLYNTLANLRQLVRLDSERALAMLDHLIRYFKLVLPSFHVERQALADELALVQTYLELLRERMDRPVRLSIDVPSAWQSFPVPPGALLCLVENAVKHGRPDDGSELHVRVSGGRDGAQMRLAVRDHGCGPGLGTRPGGTGLANLRERLRLQYGDAASLHLHAARPGCEAVIRLPVETT